MRLLRTTGTFLFAAIAALSTSGCTFLTGVRNVSKVTVSVSPSTISINQTAAAFGAAFDGSTALTSSRYAVTFTSRNPGIAQVNATSGLVIGVANGTTYIIGESNGKRDSAQITVRPVLARQAIINPRLPIFRVGAIAGLGISVIDTLGNSLGNRAITWLSRTPSTLTITNAGIVTPVAVGSTWIVASVDNGPGVDPAVDSVRATITLPPVVDLRVTPNNTNNNTPTVYVGQTLQFTVTVIDSLLNTVTRPVVWSTPSPGTLLTIDSQTGLATGIAASFYSTTIRATVDVVPGFPTSGTRTLDVTVAVLAPADSTRVRNTASTDITTLSVAPGSTTAITLTAIDVLHNALSNRTFSLTSSDAGVASVAATSSGSASITAVAVGTATITVQALDATGNPQGRKSTLTVTVQ